MYLDFFQVTLVIFTFFVLIVWLALAEYQMRYWRREAINCSVDYDFLANENTVIRHENSLKNVPKRQKREGIIKSVSQA